MRLALLLVAALTACQSSPDRARDPAVGRWQGESGKVIELRADGTLDMEPVVAPECANESALRASCKARQTWKHSGTIVALSRGAVAKPFTDPMFAQKPCECRLEGVDLQLRGDDLVYGTEHAHRVK